MINVNRRKLVARVGSKFNLPGDLTRLIWREVEAIHTRRAAKARRELRRVLQWGLFARLWLFRAVSYWVPPNKLYTDPKEEGAGEATGLPRRKNESNFFITINPNKKYPASIAGQAEDRFSAALNHLATREVLVRCLKYGPKDAWFKDDLAIDVIKDVQFTSAVETGETLGRMHTHIWLTIEHYSQIQINIPMMQYEFKTAFNKGLDFGDALVLAELPYLQVKLLPQSDWTSVMRQYIKKGMRGDTRHRQDMPV